MPQWRPVKDSHITFAYNRWLVAAREVCGWFMGASSIAVVAAIMWRGSR